MAAPGTSMPQATLRCTHIVPGLDAPARRLLLVSVDRPTDAAIYVDTCPDCGVAMMARTQWNTIEIQSRDG